MARNRSLDDFIDPQSGSDTDDDTEIHTEPAPDPDADADADGDADTEPDCAGEAPGPAPAPASALDAGPALTTMSWDPDGAACEACDTVVERRWRDDDALVCDGCKEW